MLPVEVESRMEAFRAELTGLGIELVEVQFRRAGARNVLVFVVDKKGDVTLEECAQANRCLGAYLEGEAESGVGLWQGSYFLEVNSPGLDRPLRTPADFRRAEGERLRVHWRGQDGRTATSVGGLRAVDEAGIDLAPDGREGVVQRILYSQMTKALRDIA